MGAVNVFGMSLPAADGAAAVMAPSVARKAAPRTQSTCPVLGLGSFGFFDSFNCKCKWEKVMQAPNGAQRRLFYCNGRACLAGGIWGERDADVIEFEERKKEERRGW